MRVRTPRSASLLVIALCALCAGCAARSRASGLPRLDRSVITREQMLQRRYATLYDAVLAMRAQWLRPRGPDSFVAPSQVWVYVNSARYGGVETLRQFQPTLVASVRFYDGPTATGLWGVGHGAGVIHVSTWGDGAVGAPRPDTARRRPPRGNVPAPRS